MISIDNLHHRYGSTVLFDGISTHIGTEDRIGLVGANGAGKTTLLRILAGKIQPDQGTVQMARAATIGYLPQEANFPDERTIYEEAESAFTEVHALRSQLSEASERLRELIPNSPSFNELLERMGEWEHRLEELEESKIRSRVEKVLLGLGFDLDALDRPISEFSGGWQMRVALARLLLREPSLLMLDEPTNHLDLDSLRWLEKYLSQYNGSLLVISHDRRFLDVLCGRIFFLQSGRLEIYNGNYSAFEMESQLRREQREQQKKNQDRAIARTEQFIERFRYKESKARQVQSRIKALDKVERIVVESDTNGIHFRFPQPPRSGRTVLRLADLGKSYGDHVVFNRLSLEVERGERIAIIGRNGAGKSTLTRILAGDEGFQNGERTLGHNVTLSYFAQHQTAYLNDAKSVLETVSDGQPEEIRKNIRTLLGAFLFEGDAVFKPVSVLSGGEKNRLALIRMLLLRSNCMILDEPTNHLDMRSKSVLAEALQEWDGTLLIVSHDRDFLEPLVTRIWHVKQGGIEDFPGSLPDYIERLEAQEKAASIAYSRPIQNANTGTGDVDPSGTARDRRRRDAERRQRLAPMRKTLHVFESSIAELETQIADWESQMASADFYRDGERAAEIMRAYERSKKDLQSIYEQWESLTMNIESLQNEL